MALISLRAFLPADLIGRPGWRDGLEALGVEIANLNIIQSRMALDYHAVYLFLAFAALWTLGLRFSGRATSHLALTALKFLQSGFLRDVNSRRYAETHTLDT